jgi:catechol 2,3-dioxygenase
MLAENDAMATPTHPATALRAGLFELALHSADPDRLAAFYSNGLGYQFTRDATGLLGTARDRRLRILTGEPRKVGYAAYAVQDQGDLDALCARLDAAEVSAEPLDLPGFLPGAVRFSDPDGNRFVFGRAAGGGSLPPTSSGQRAARMQHVVFASTNIQRELEFFVETMGFQLTDRVVDENGGLRTGFVRCSQEHHSLAVFAAPENRLDHHCYEAGDWGLIRDWADHFASLLVPLKWGPGRHGPGHNLFLFVHDPDGNWVEISAELEHVAPDRPVGEWPHSERTLNCWGIGMLRS